MSLQLRTVLIAGGSALALAMAAPASATDLLISPQSEAERALGGTTGNLAVWFQGVFGSYDREGGVDESDNEFDNLAAGFGAHSRVHHDYGGGQGFQLEAIGDFHLSMASDETTTMMMTLVRLGAPSVVTGSHVTIRAPTVFLPV